MCCDVCENTGFVEIEVGSEDSDNVLKPCQVCSEPCSICEDTGIIQNREYVDIYTRDPTGEDCPVCWESRTCPKCYGDGSEEYGAFDPSLGHYDGYVTDCETCSGTGEINDQWRGNGAPPDDEFNF